jgi:hypothetical protein
VHGRDLERRWTQLRRTLEDQAREAWWDQGRAFAPSHLQDWSANKPGVHWLWSAGTRQYEAALEAQRSGRLPPNTVRDEDRLASISTAQRSQHSA